MTVATLGRGIYRTSVKMMQELRAAITNSSLFPLETPITIPIHPIGAMLQVNGMPPYNLKCISMLLLQRQCKNTHKNNERQSNTSNFQLQKQQRF